MNRSFKTSPGKNPGAATLWGLFLLLTVGFALPTQAQFTAQNDTVATMLIGQNCANGAIDPGETVTMSFRIKNTSGAAKANVKATLLQQGNVTFPVTHGGQTFPYGSGQITIGAMADNAISTVSFTFRAEGTCGGFITPAISVVADGTAAQTVTFSNITPTTPANSPVNNELGLRVPTERTTATGFGATIPTSGAITIQDGGPALTSTTGLGRASAYPSTITVSGVPHVTDSALLATGERVSKVEVLVNGLSHAFSQDVQLLLVGPQGQNVMLMNDTGAQSGTQSLNNVNLVFSEKVGTTTTVASLLPQTTAIDPSGAAGTTITARPSNYGPNDTMPSGAPAGPYGSNLDVFGTNNRTLTPPNPNGDWKLYIVDDTGGGVGTITSWSLRITTMKIDCCTTAAGGSLPNVAVTSVTAINEDSTASNTPQNIATLSVNDVEGGVLTLTASSANTALVTSANLEITEGNPTLTAGAVVTRTVRVKGNGLIAHQFGTSVITVTGTDPQGNVSTTLFTLTVNPVNDLPTITAFANQSANVGQPTPVLNVTIAEEPSNETAVADLTLIGTSTDQSVVPNGNIFFTGNTGARTVQVFPASSTTSGTATIRVTVRDRGATDNGSGPGEAFREFVVAFNVQPGFPTVTPISTQTMDEDGAAKVVSFQVAAGTSSTTLPQALVVSASSSSTAVVASSGISIVQPAAGTGVASVTLTPTANAFGSTTITLTVTDSGFTPSRATSTTFVLTVNPINDTPTISALADESIAEDSSTATLTFTIADVEDGTSLQLTASSSDTSIVPSTIVTAASLPGVTFGGSAGNRTVSARPALDAFGSAAITVTVTDSVGGATGTASRTFRVTVSAVNDNPVITQAGISGGTLVNLASSATDAPIAVTVGEDSANFTVALAGVLPGPVNEDPDQSVDLSITSADTAKVDIRTNDSGTLTYGSTRTYSNVGTDPTFVLRAKSNATGDTAITLVLTDNLGLTTTRKFTVRITAGNDQPTLAAIADRPAEQSGAGLSVSISVSDAETAAGSLTVTAASSNQAVVKDSNIFSVAGNTQLSLLTETAPGTTVITVTVRDPEGLVATRSFTLTTSNVAPPSITISPASITIDEDTITSATITASGQGTLTFTKSSTIPTLIPTDNVIISGSGGTRTLVLVPASDQPTTAPGTSLTSVISVTVTDARGASATATFALTVRAIPDSPTLALLGNLSSGSLTMLEDATATADSTRTSTKFEIRAFDAEDGNGGTLTVVSSNTGLFPTGFTATGETSASSAVAGVAIGTATADGTRQIQFKPVANKNGTATLTLTQTDTSGRVGTTTLNVTVTDVNDEPELTQPTTPINLNEDFTTQTIVLTGITAGVSAAGESAQTLAVSVSTANATPNTTSPNTFLTATVTPTVTSDGTATLTLAPIANQGGGSVNVTVTVTDSGGTANSGDNAVSRVILVNVASVNDRPTLTFAGTTSTVIQPGGTAGFTVVPFTIGDVETSAFALTVSAVSDNAAVVISPTATDFGGSGTDRSVKLTAATAVVGTAAAVTANVTITLSDGTVADDRTHVLAVTVRIPSQNPEITITPATVTAPPNTESSVITVNVSDFQQAASQLTVTYTSDNQAMIPNGSQTVGSGQNGGTSSVVFSGTGTASRLIIVRPPTFGTANLTFTVHDNIGGTPDNTGTATLRVVASTAPTATPDQTNVNLAQGAAATTIGVTVADPNETPSGFITLTATSSNQTLLPNANITVVVGSANNRRNVTFTPVANQVGTATITLVPRDGDGVTGSATINVTVANAAPTISGAFTATIAANGSGTQTYTVADTETATASLGTLGVTAGTSNATLIPAANIVIVASGATRTVTITPAANQSGSATITFTVTDSQAGTGSATLLVTVSNAAPTITPPAAQSITESSSTGVLAFTVADSDGAVSSVTVVGTSSNTTLVPNSGISIPSANTGAGRTVNVTPVAGQSGTSTITLTASDALGATGTATFQVVVVANSAPTITGLPSTLAVQQSQSGTVAFTVNDTETAAASVQTTYTSSNSALVNATTGIQQATATSGSRTVVITPTVGQSGTTTITVTATDGGGKTAQGSFTLTASSNTSPTITSLANQTVNKNTPTSSQSFTINDTETPTSLTVSPSSSNTTLVPAANVVLSGTGNARSVVVTPANNQVGTATVTVTVADAGGLTASAIFTVTVLQTAPVKGDMDGDGQSDILLQDSDGFLAVWLMNGRNLKSASFLLPSNLGDTNYRIAGTGDFNRDGQEDIIFQHTDGTMAVWFMSGTSQESAQIVTPSSTGANWMIVAVADMDADQNADLLFQHTDGSLAVWYMNGLTQRSASLLSPSNPGNSAWRVVGVGDFNTDTKQDLAFQHTDGTLAVWYMNGIAMTQPTFMTPNNAGAGWRVVGVADRNSDGKADLLFQHTDYTLATWSLNGVTLSTAQLLNPSNSGATWRAVSPK